MIFQLDTAQVSVLVDLHRRSGWWVVGIMGAVGVFGLILALLKRPPGRVFYTGLGLAVVAVITQVGLGLYGYSVIGRQPGNIHIFYGVVALFTLAFAYLYRVQFARRPALAYGLLALFLMGVGIRAITGLGRSFGG